MPHRPRPPRPDVPLPAGAAGLRGRPLVIEYQDAAGRRRLRPVTLWSVKPGRDGVPRLLAHSHDRDDIRSFRLDRIVSIADADGVLQEPLEAFYRDVLGVSWPPGRLRAVEGEPSGERWAVIRAIGQDNGLVLAAAVALADLEMSGEEVAVMLDHLTSACAADGIRLDQHEVERARAWIRRMRPSPAAVDKHLGRLEGAAVPTRRRIVETCLAVADSDGFRHHKELLLIDEFARVLVGEGILPGREGRSPK